MEISDIAPQAVRVAGGYWSTGEAPEISYPASGNEFCAEVEDRSFWFAHRNRAILSAVRRFPPVKGPIFDVGAGNGFVAQALVNAGFPTVAIEPHHAGASLAAQRGLPLVLCGSLPSSSVRTERAGALALFDVIEHVERDREWLSSLKAYVRPGGRLYITTPAYMWLWSSIDEQSGHFRRYSLRALREMVKQAGFSIEFGTYIFWCLPPAMFLARALARRSAPASASEHTIGGSSMRAATRLLFGWEAVAIRAGVPVPFGGSCLLVARRTV